MQSEANTVEYDGINSRYFTSLEKKRSVTKLISTLFINNSIGTNQRETITEIKYFYKSLYGKRQLNIKI